MKILLVGDWHSDIHEEPAACALEQLGHEVSRFKLFPYFRAHRRPLGLTGIDGFVRRVQYKLLAGPLLSTIARDMGREAARMQPDVVFVYRGIHVKRSALEAVRRAAPSARIVGYNNDDPFSGQHVRRLWRHFLDGVPEYDLMFAYRERNLEDFTRAGARRVALLRSWYLPEQNRPVQLSPEDRARFGCDVVFAGHYEPDRRLEYLARVASAGHDLRIFGPTYPDVCPMPALSRFWPVRAVRGADYNKAICGAKVALCFLSTLNRDTYTRRCFEIPAAGTLLLSAYSDDLASLFTEGVEADFFRTPDELVQKLNRYLADEPLRRSVAEAGRRRVLADGHDVVSRMRQMTGELDRLIHAA